MSNKIIFEGHVYILEESRRIDREIESGNVSSKVNIGEPFAGYGEYSGRKSYSLGDKDNVHFNQHHVLSTKGDPNAKSTQLVRDILKQTAHNDKLSELINTIEENIDLDSETPVTKLARDLIWELQKKNGYKQLKSYSDAVKSTGVANSERKASY